MFKPSHYRHRASDYTLFNVIHICWKKIFSKPRGLIQYRDPIVEIRRSYDRLISTIGFLYTGKTASLYRIRTQGISVDNPSVFFAAGTYLKMTKSHNTPPFRNPILIQYISTAFRISKVYNETCFWKSLWIERSDTSIDHQWHVYVASNPVQRNKLWCFIVA